MVHRRALCLLDKLVLIIPAHVLCAHDMRPDGKSLCHSRSGANQVRHDRTARQSLPLEGKVASGVSRKPDDG